MPAETMNIGKFKLLRDWANQEMTLLGNAIILNAHNPNGTGAMTISIGRFKIYSGECFHNININPSSI
jgi:hypothetical protein